MTEQTQYRVTAPYVTTKCATGALLPAQRGDTVVLGFYQGATLPPSADPADVAHLVRCGFVEEVGADG